MATLPARRQSTARPSTHTSASRGWSPTTWQASGCGTRQPGARPLDSESSASPIVHGDLVIVNASIESQAVIAFDKHSGDERWRISDVKKSWTTPLVAAANSGEAELIVSYLERVEGFDPASGKRLWTCQGIQDYVVPSVVAREGRRLLSRWPQEPINRDSPGRARRCERHARAVVDQHWGQCHLARAAQRSIVLGQ